MKRKKDSPKSHPLRPNGHDDRRREGKTSFRTYIHSTPMGPTTDSESPFARKGFMKSLRIILMLCLFTLAGCVVPPPPPGPPLPPPPPPPPPPPFVPPLPPPLLLGFSQSSQALLEGAELVGLDA